MLPLKLSLHQPLLSVQAHDLLAPALHLLLNGHVLNVELLILDDLLLEVLGELLGAVVERVVVAQVLLHRRAGLGELLLELVDLHARLVDLVGHGLLLVRLRVELLAGLPQLLIEPLAPALLPLDLRLARVELLLQAADLLGLGLVGIIQTLALRVEFLELALEHLGLRLLLLRLPLQLLARLHQLLHHGLLPVRHLGALLHQLGKVRDLVLEVVDGLLRTALLLVRHIDELPRLLDLLAQRRDGVLVLLAQLERGVDLGRIVHDLRVELAHLLDQLALVLVRALEGPVKLLVLHPEALERLVSHQVRKDLLEVTLEGLERRGGELGLLLAILLARAIIVRRVHPAASLPVRPCSQRARTWGASSACASSALKTATALALKSGAQRLPDTAALRS
mmetsp:Transcript_91585/g.261776  ORF Transcript_91585/g.261776 Transcript_91585/m.261776 type:complete len:395 (+) Transcript_91585:1989-3173(+)